MSTQPYDVAIVGGGIVGLATALSLVESGRPRLVVLEAEDDFARHQTGHNSGVIHSGLYYKPGSLKARLCAEGREAMFAFCRQNDIPHERCGKVVVATDPRELPRLDELERRGRANGLEGIERIGPEQIREHEPHAAGIAGLWVPQTGIVAYVKVAEAMTARIRAAGGEVLSGARVTGCRRSTGEITLETPRGAFSCRTLVACAGLHCDELARMCGLDPGIRIIPFRGEYYMLKTERRSLVRNLIYPVPDPRFPFLGVHFTRRVTGEVEAGPNAVLAWKREGYGRGSFALGDTIRMLGFSGFWHMGLKHWRTALDENWRSASKGAFVKALQKLLPELRPEDVEPGHAGVRAQAVAPDGRLLDDFHLVEDAHMVHVLNAPSPAATASLAIGRSIADRLKQRAD